MVKDVFEEIELKQIKKKKQDSLLIQRKAKRCVSDMMEFDNCEGTWGAQIILSAKGSISF